MRLLFLTLLISGCANLKTPEHQMATAPAIEMEMMDPVHSRVQIFLEDDFHPNQRFFIHLRNENRKRMDVPEHDFHVFTPEENTTPKVNRISQGRYQVVFEQNLKRISSMKFFVQGLPLKHDIENFPKPEKIKGKIQLVKKSERELILRLSLKNMRGEGLKTPHDPDFIIEGGAHISDIVRLQVGLWEFKLSLPEDNQIIYLSTRSNGVQLDRLFRYQHIEK